MTVAKPDLMFRIGDRAVIREFKTAGALPIHGADEVYSQHLQVPFLLAMLSSGLTEALAATQATVEVEVLTPEASAVYAWDTDSHALISAAKSDVKLASDRWHVDSTWETNPGRHCDWCPVRHWCPDRDVYSSTPRGVDPTEDAPVLDPTAVLGLNRSERRVNRHTPTPADMPRRRRPRVPTSSGRLRRPSFASAPQIPQRGWSDAIIWPDTGVLLTLGVADDLPGRFRACFGQRVKVPRKVENELRGHSDDRASDDHSLAKANAAALVLQQLFVGGRVFAAPELEESDYHRFDAVMLALKSLPGADGRTHGGEAVAITLASRERDATGARHVIAANDAGASQIARRYGIPCRHAADILAEISCHDDELTATRCLALFNTARTFTAPPRYCCPETTDAFTCHKEQQGCEPCDGVTSSN